MRSPPIPHTFKCTCSDPNSFKSHEKVCGCVGAERLISPSGVLPRFWSGWFNLVDLWMIFDVCVCLCFARC